MERSHRMPFVAIASCDQPKPVPFLPVTRTSTDSVCSTARSIRVAPAPRSASSSHASAYSPCRAARWATMIGFVHHPARM